MGETDQLLETLQADILAVLKNSPSLPGANIFSDNDGDLDSRVMTALGTRKSTGGMRGLAVIVLPLEVMAAEIPNHTSTASAFR